MGKAGIEPHDDARHADDPCRIVHRQEGWQDLLGGMIARCAGRSLGQPSGPGLFGGRAPEPDQIQPSPLQVHGHLDPLVFRPELGVAAGTGDQQGQRAPPGQPGGLLRRQGRNRQAEAGWRVDAIAQRRRSDGPVAAYDVPVTRYVDLLVVGQCGERFPCRSAVGPHTMAASLEVCQTHDGRTLDEPLAVENPVVAASLQCAQKIAQRLACIGLAQ